MSWHRLPDVPHQGAVTHSLNTHTLSHTHTNTHTHTHTLSHTHTVHTHTHIHTCSHTQQNREQQAQENETNGTTTLFMSYLNEIPDIHPWRQQYTQDAHPP